MRVQTSFAHVERLSRILGSIYSSARWGGSSHEEILKQLNARVWGDPAYSRLPEWARVKLSERNSSSLASLYDPSLSGIALERALERAARGESVKPFPYLRWALFLDGREVTSDEISRLASEDPRAWERVEGAHIWNHRPDRYFAPRINTYQSVPTSSKEGSAA